MWPWAVLYKQPPLCVSPNTVKPSFHLAVGTVRSRNLWQWKGALASGSGPKSFTSVSALITVTVGGETRVTCLWVISAGAGLRREPANTRVVWQAHPRINTLTAYSLVFFWHECFIVLLGHRSLFCSPMATGTRQRCDKADMSAVFTHFYGAAWLVSTEG